MALPRPPSLVAQTVAALERQIETSTWHEWLPGERALCEMLQVSRSTLRLALRQLQQKGVIRAEHGAGNRILSGEIGRRGVGSADAQDVALLSAAPVQELPSMQALWIDELRGLLNERGRRLRVFHGRQYFRGDSSAALEKLVSQAPHCCWIVHRGTEPVQRWFAASRVPCVLAGSPYPGIELPFRDVDRRAAVRHAVNTFQRLGHRRIAFVTPRERCAGDAECEEAFLADARTGGFDARATTIVRVESTVPEISVAVRRLIEAPLRPTGILIASAYHYSTVATRLAQLGVRVPQDVTLICREDEPFLSFMLPEPARYLASPARFARMLLRPVLQAIDGVTSSSTQSLLMPEFVAGNSIAPCASEPAVLSGAGSMMSLLAS